MNFIVAIRLSVAIDDEIWHFVFSRSLLAREGCD